jgi:oxygen-independent coproporphyrinogen-3 oxidase
MRAADARVAPEPELRFDLLPPLSLYVHLPWCVRKCPYCDFNSYEAKGRIGDRAYVGAVLRDLDAEAPLAQGRSVETVFIGGGTPSLFSGEAIAALLDGIRARLNLAEDVEITLEANPGAIDAAHFREYRHAGVNRLSIGVQSFRAPQLQALGRVHSGEEAERAVAVARAAGFGAINLDLMYALPGDDVAGSIGDLTHAIALEPGHLSWYQLTLEPNTAFERRPPALPGDEFVAEIELHGRELLASAGYERYEVSAYAQAERRCRHNLNYWQFGDYLGLGAGAHGKVTLREPALVERRAKTRNPRTYQQAAGQPGAVSIEHIAVARQVAVEFLLNALRLPDGVADEVFAERAGQSLANIAAARAVGVEHGWLSAAPGTLRTTPAGFQVLNRLLELFV